MAGRGGIESLLYLLDEAFRGPGIEASNESQALLPNLRSVRPEWWHALPAGATRSIGAIALHVGACKIMYDDYAFGSASLRFGTADVEPWPEDEVQPETLIPWLEAAHRRLVEHVAALDDDEELVRPRLANWGEQRETRWLVAAMISHDAYHAGEINHLRSLLDGDDRWRYVQLGFG